MSNNRNKNAARFAEMFKALSNPHRLKIFLRLASCCPPAPAGKIPLLSEEACACVGELGKDLGIVASTVSHHIKELQRAGLIFMKRSGKTVQCRVEPKVLDELSGFFSELNKS
jgi:ArsR family transcriptional regulator